jgi:hypothetical protein
MRRLLIILSASCLFFACQNSDSTRGGIPREEGMKVLRDSSNYTTMLWLDSTFKDMGQIKEGKKVEISFRFKNTGSKNLVITDVTASCGCTIPEKPGKPYAPGEEGTIKATFNSNGHPVGEDRKQVYVTANTLPSNSHVLSFRFEITE